VKDNKDPKSPKKDEKLPAGKDAVKDNKNAGK
jgi:hypothetical protein